VIQFKVGYNELANRDLGENEEKFLQVEEQACNGKLFVELEENKYVGIFLS